MADSALKFKDYENAEKLFKETAIKCVAAGRSKDDVSVVEISVKLASLYALQSRDEEAETGFKYCVDTMNKKVKEEGGVLEADTNTLALQGLSCQSYARFLMKKKQQKEAINLYKQSLDIAKEVYGLDHPQVIREHEVKQFFTDAITIAKAIVSLTINSCQLNSGLDWCAWTALSFPVTDVPIAVKDYNLLTFSFVAVGKTLVVLNDLASAYVISHQYKEGIELYKEAADRAEKMGEMEESLVAFYYNLGEACIVNNDFDLAKKYCTRCLKYAEHLGNAALVQTAKQCLKDVKEVKAKQIRQKDDRQDEVPKSIT